MERNSRHPVALAVSRVAARANVALKDVTDFRETPGKGVVGVIG